MAKARCHHRVVWYLDCPWCESERKVKDIGGDYLITDEDGVGLVNKKALERLLA